MATRLCIEVGCPNEVAYRGRCKDHARSRDRSIARSGRGIYHTKRWKMTRRRQLHDHPLCARCGAVATDVDHIESLDQGGAIWSFANLQSLCARCHGAKTRAEQLAV